MFDDGRYEKSAHGDFYIELYESEKHGRGCCTAAWPPHEMAPNLCSFDEIGKKRFCYVEKQPENEKELYEMLVALWSCEMRCLVYSGSDLGILMRLKEIGRIDDSKDALTRNICTFDNANKKRFQIDELADAFEEYLSDNLNSDYRSVHFKDRVDEKDSSSFYATWYTNIPIPPNKPEHVYHKITLRKDASIAADWALIHDLVEDRSGSKGLSMWVYEFLGELDSFENFRFFSQEEWNDGEPTFWRSTPY